MVQLPEPTENKEFPNIAEIAKERIRRVIARLQSEEAEKLPFESPQCQQGPRGDALAGAAGSGSDLDLGFKVFKLAKPNIQQWVPEANRDPDAYAEKLSLFNDPLVAGWTPENVLWEVALREGYSLNTRFAKKELPNGNAVFEVTDPDKEPPQAFIVCLDDEIRADLSKHLDLSPARLFVCRDNALDDTAAANLALQCRLKTI